MNPCAKVFREGGIPLNGIQFCIQKRKPRRTFCQAILAPAADIDLRHDETREKVAPLTPRRWRKKPANSFVDGDGLADHERAASDPRMKPEFAHLYRERARRRAAWLRSAWLRSAWVAHLAGRGKKRLGKVEADAIVLVCRMSFRLPVCVRTAGLEP
jgi:hypothetical protein